LEPPDVYRRLIERQDADGADLVMGLFPTDQDERSDMVELDDDGRVRSLVIKQPPRGLEYSWAAGVWTPAFTSFLRDFVDRTDFDDESREVHTSEAMFGPRPGMECRHRDLRRGSDARHRHAGRARTSAGATRLAA
jgi:hypothetical protein